MAGPHGLVCNPIFFDLMLSTQGYFMDVSCICFMSIYVISFDDMLKFSSVCIECLCMAPPTPIVMVMRGFDLPTFGPKCLY